MFEDATTDPLLLQLMELETPTLECIRKRWRAGVLRIPEGELPRFPQLNSFRGLDRWISITSTPRLLALVHTTEDHPHTILFLPLIIEVHLRTMAVHPLTMEVHLLTMEVRLHTMVVHPHTIEDHLRTTGEHQDTILFLHLITGGDQVLNIEVVPPPTLVEASHLIIQELGHHTILLQIDIQG